MISCSFFFFINEKKLNTPLIRLQGPFLQAMAYKQYNNLVASGIPPENIIVISPDSAAYYPR